jgi:esterase/lipase superfamily enzyme
MVFFGITFFEANQNQKKHFTLGTIEALSEDELIQAMKKEKRFEDSALVFIHGYNSSFDDAIFKTAQIAFDTHFSGVPIAFCWPSKHSITGYDYDRESAAFSWDALLQLLHLIKEGAGISKIYIIAHSMGNQMLLDALARARDDNNRLSLSEIIMASPDIDRDVFLKRMDQLRLLAGGLTLYASSADKAMIASHLKAGGLRTGDISDDGPVIAQGLDTIDITSLGDDPFALNHGTALNSRSVIDDIGRLLHTGIHPAGNRSPQLVPVPADPPTRYWKYPQ